MKRRMLAAICCVIIISLSGCQLAREAVGSESGADRLAGVFMTTEYLDLFDIEGFIGGGGSNSERYQGRLYAELVTRTLTNEDTGEQVETQEYAFNGVEGILYISVLVPDKEREGEFYTSSISGEGISDGHLSIAHSDTENSMSLEGTIYTAPAAQRYTYYFNPVYQSADGRVYAESGSGFQVIDEAYSEGQVYTQSFDSETTVTENGVSKTDSVSVKISISVVLPPEKVVILQMDREGGIVLRQEYAPALMPDVMTPEADAAYLIVEKYKRGETGEIEVSRELYGEDAVSFGVFVAGTDGICIEHPTEIDWSRGKG